MDNNKEISPDIKQDMHNIAQAFGQALSPEQMQGIMDAIVLSRQKDSKSEEQFKEYLHNRPGLGGINLRENVQLKKMVDTISKYYEGKDGRLFTYMKDLEKRDGRSYTVPTTRAKLQDLSIFYGREIEKEKALAGDIVGGVQTAAKVVQQGAQNATAAMDGIDFGPNPFTRNYGAAVDRMHDLREMENMGRATNTDLQELEQLETQHAEHKAKASTPKQEQVKDLDKLKARIDDLREMENMGRATNADLQELEKLEKEVGLNKLEAAVQENDRLGEKHENKPKENMHRGEGRFHVGPDGDFITKHISAEPGSQMQGKGDDYKNKDRLEIVIDRYRLRTEKLKAELDAETDPDQREKLQKEYEHRMGVMERGDKVQAARDAKAEKNQNLLDRMQEAGINPKDIAKFSFKLKFNEITEGTKGYDSMIKMLEKKENSIREKQAKQQAKEEKIAAKQARKEERNVEPEPEPEKLTILEDELEMA